MNIFIFSSNRKHLRVLDKFPKALYPYTQLVIPFKQVSAYGSQEINLLPVPDHLYGINRTRQYVIEKYPAHKVIFLDDDIHFYARRLDNPQRLEPATDIQIHKVLSMLDTSLQTYAHGGIAARQGHCFLPQQPVYNQRYIRILGYNTIILNKYRVRFDRLPLMEDFDVALQLLRMGYPSILHTNYAQDQSQTQAAGGCSDYRTQELHTAAAKKLQEHLRS